MQQKNRITVIYEAWVKIPDVVSFLFPGSDYLKVDRFYPRIEEIKAIHEKANKDKASEN